MVDGKQYFAHFPDEEPVRLQALLHSPKLLATLRALEKELRPYFEQAASRVDANDSNGG